MNSLEPQTGDALSDLWASSEVEPAPKSWARQCTHSENRLHQLSPYIGKLKSSIASDLILRYTSPGDAVLDPFCGSGTVPLECAILGRRSIGCDTNPYAVLLTKAKLSAPTTADEAIARFHSVHEESLSRESNISGDCPEWVRKFFHPATLDEALRFADQCIDQDEAFLLACLLGILHHQRPGFLSYPSSHLIPYLREKKYPRSDYPEMYEKRELGSRMIAKIKRALRTPIAPQQDNLVGRVPVESFALDEQVDAIITSPPYMNALDYVRDNRLRMWVLDRNVVDYQREATDSSGSFDQLMQCFINNCLSQLKIGGTAVLVVGERVRRKRMTSHPAECLLNHISNETGNAMTLEKVIRDTIPDVRRARREGAATKRELILVLRKSKDFEMGSEPAVRRATAANRGFMTVGYA